MYYSETPVLSFFVVLSPVKWIFFVGWCQWPIGGLNKKQASNNRRPPLKKQQWKKTQTLNIDNCWWMDFKKWKPPSFGGCRLDACFSTSLLSRVEISFSPSPLNPPCPEKEEAFLLFGFPPVWPVCPCPCLNVSSSIFLDSFLRSTADWGVGAGFLSS